MTNNFTSDTHQQAYPEQYTHSLVGRHVSIAPQGKTLASGVVERVVSTRFGLLAILTGDKEGRAWAVGDCKPTESEQENQ